MTQGRQIHDAIQWHEGMLLLPQHFQQMDRRIEHLIAYHTQVTLPYAWGIIDFNYDISAVLSGRIDILNFEVVMPDGSILGLGAAQQKRLFLDLSPYHDDLQREEMTLYVVIVPYQAGKGNASSDHPRFSSIEATAVVDENTGGNVISIPTLSPNFMLKLSKDEPIGYVSLPLLKLQRIDHVYRVSNYLPPQLKVAVNSPLSDLCRMLTHRVREKILFLVNRLSSQTLDMVSENTENLIKSLSAGLLPLETMIGSGVSHPFHVYVQLVQFVAQLIGIAPGVMPPLLKMYQHNNVRTSFSEVLDFAHTLLDRIQEGYYAIPFALEGRTFNLKLNSEWKLENLIIGVKASLKMSDKDLTNWIAQAVMATDNHVDMCRARRILGASRRFVTGIEQEKFVPARDVVLFELTIDEHCIDFGQILQIFNVADQQEGRPEEMVLYLSKKDRF